MPLMKGTIYDSFCLWIEKRKAIYQEGLGAMLVDDFDETTPHNVLKRTKIISGLAPEIRNLKTLFQFS
jgi:hypothetical protein